MSANPKIDDGGVAFPKVVSEATSEVDAGMSLRDYYVGIAMGHLITSTTGSVESLIKFCGKQGVHPADQLAITSYQLADAMIKEKRRTE